MSENMDEIKGSASASEEPKGGDTITKSDVTSNGDSLAVDTTAVWEERTISIDDLEDEAEYSEEEYGELLGLYEQTLTDFVEGELVVGKILAINDNDVAVDIGFKSEGVIPIDEFGRPDSINVGDDIEVFLDKVEDNDGQLVLSKRKADFLRTWGRVIDSHENGETLVGVCSRRIKGGMVVDLQGVDAFLPGSQIDVRPVRDFDALIGQEMEFKIVKVNEMRKNIVVSHRVLIEEGMREQREKILENLEKGQILEGIVKNITDFGVFIDLGGVDGLLHINDLSWGRVSHPSEAVSLDEKIKIQILDFNDEKNRISLGLKQLQPHPWDNVKDKYTEGEVIKGKVVNISDYGAFIELEKGVEGLIHISEMSWTQHIKHPSKVLALGEVIDAKILNIDNEGRKISLGLKQLEPDPWEGIEAKYPVDTRQTGTVRNLTNFGAFVELEEGVDGLIHISDLSWTKKIRHPGEVLKKGDEVNISVLNIDPGNRRISLGYKQTMDNPWDTFEEKYGVEAKATGKVVRMIEKGVIIELPEEVDGFVPMSQLAKEGLRKPSDGYQVGDELELVVIEFNKENKKIILSEKQSVDAGHMATPPDEEAIAAFEEEVKASKGKDKPKAAKGPSATAESETETKTEVKAAKDSSATAESETETKTEAKDAEAPVAEAEAAKESVAAEATSEAPTDSEDSGPAISEGIKETEADEAEVTEEVTEEVAEEVAEAPGDAVAEDKNDDAADDKDSDAEKETKA